MLDLPLYRLIQWANIFARPGTALLFALTIVEILSRKEKRDEVAGPMVVAETL